MEQCEVEESKLQDIRPTTSGSEILIGSANLSIWLLLQPMWPGVEQTTTVFHRQQADVASLESARILRDFEAVKA